MKTKYMRFTPTQLPKQRRQFICTKCGSSECVGTMDIEHPPCAKCNYLGIAMDVGYTKEDMEAYGKVEYARAVGDALELIRFHGGTIQLEAHTGQLLYSDIISKRGMDPRN